MAPFIAAAEIGAAVSPAIPVARGCDESPFRLAFDK